MPVYAPRQPATLYQYWGKCGKHSPETLTNIVTKPIINASLGLLSGLTITHKVRLYETVNILLLHRKASEYKTKAQGMHGKLLAHELLDDSYFDVS